MTQDAYFLLMTYTKQLLLVTFRDTLQELELVFGQTETDRWTDERTDGWTDERTDGRTDKRGSQNSYLDFSSVSKNEILC